MNDTSDLTQILAFFQGKLEPLPGDREYDAALCERLMAATSAQAASIWRLDDRGLLRLVHGTNLAPEQVAASDVPVVISGETGTGKELAARRIHEESARAGKPFLEVNCAALAETLLESELFGHVKGAFTGAERDRRGRFLAAKSGTLFLDEISEMSPACQAKILRALQEKKITPVGSEEEIECDVRILAATNCDLWSLVKEGRFREDLYFRLCAIEIEIPPLSKRTEDIPLLVQYFFDQACADKRKRKLAFAGPRLSPQATEMLCSLPWPGNVRQLKEALLAALAICESDEIGPADFPASLHKATFSSTKGAASPADSRPARQTPQTSSDDDGRYAEERERYLRSLDSTKYPGTGRYNLAAGARQLRAPDRASWERGERRRGLAGIGPPKKAVKLIASRPPNLLQVLSSVY